MPSFRANRRPIEVAEFSGRYWELGDASAPPIVLLPSQLARGQAYLRTAQAIAARGFRVVMVEMPGSGGGSRLHEPWTLKDYAPWVAAFLQRLSLRGVTLIGHSNSGATALVVAAEDPALVGRLILADSTGARPLGSIPGVIACHAPEFPFEYWFNWRAGPDVFYNMLMHWRNFWGQVGSAVREVVIDRAPRVRTPTLVAWGWHDHTVPGDCAKLFARAIPGARLYWSEDGRHDWIIERPEEFAGVIARFVNHPQSFPMPAGR
jgi:2-hydroxy-6-oxonona-2,4-dienedioate hydrolase